MADTGMRSQEMINLAVDNVMRIRTLWLAPGMSPLKRMQLLVACTFKVLDALRIPHCGVEYDPNMYATSGNSGVYSGNNWKLEVDSSFASDEKVRAEGDLALRECFDTVYHETRHYEQHFRARYYMLTAGSQWEHFRSNLKITAESQRNGVRGKPVQQMIHDCYGIPLEQATAYWTMFSSRFQYTGEALVETKTWHEEYWGKHRDARGDIMNKLSAPNRRASIYDLYRTIFMEDDGWHTGYQAGDTYLARAFQERKATMLKTIETAQGRYDQLKVANDRKRAAIDQGVAKFRKEGGQALLNKIRQVAAEVKSDDERLGKLEVWINTQKSLLTEDQSKTQGVIRKHRESMTQHRLKAYDSRARRGIYLGTARQS